jgi:hypothetical protein
VTRFGGVTCWTIYLMAMKELPQMRALERNQAVPRLRTVRRK